MFSQTFLNCTNLKTIPAGLFGGLDGAPASQMFYEVFRNCVSLMLIPENLFGNIYGEAQGYMFYLTFYECCSLTGNSAKINGRYLYDIWPDFGGRVYFNARGLTDYADIPAAWK
jgi:hypothetical protein